MRALKAMVILIVIIAIPTLIIESIAANGGKGKTTNYYGEIAVDQAGRILFSTEIEKVLFSLNSVQNKYKVVRIKIVNHSNKSLHLSRKKDKMELHLDSGSIIAAALDLSSHDSIIWDTFDADMRKTLVYPKVVESNEEENIFIFIPKEKLKELPEIFRYTIDSLPAKNVDIIMVRKASAK